MQVTAYLREAPPDTEVVTEPTSRLEADAVALLITVQKLGSLFPSSCAFAGRIRQVRSSCQVPADACGGTAFPTPRSTEVPPATSSEQRGHFQRRIRGPEADRWRLRTAVTKAKWIEQRSRGASPGLESLEGLERAVFRRSRLSASAARRLRRKRAAERAQREATSAADKCTALMSFSQLGRQFCKPTCDVT